ncbi:MAG: helix-turn-helix domain-containing protein, partial [Anaerolineales bacterium]|nr:helix-turn-helix domain-containing protein [Anaerolineales bacterium]
CLRNVPDMVNRALRKLAEKGMIRVELYQIKILDKEGLKAVAQTIEKLAIVRSSQVGSVTPGSVISVIIFL